MILNWLTHCVLYCELAGKPVRGLSAACLVALASSRGSSSADRALGTAPLWSILSAAPVSLHQSPHRPASSTCAHTGRSALTGARWVNNNILWLQICLVHKRVVDKYCRWVHNKCALKITCVIFLKRLLQCSVDCGIGRRTRSIRCVSEEGSVVNEKECNSRQRPQGSEECNMGPCVTNWYFTDWSHTVSNNHTNNTPTKCTLTESSTFPVTLFWPVFSSVRPWCAEERSGVFDSEWHQGRRGRRSLCRRETSRDEGLQWRSLCGNNHVVHQCLDTGISKQTDVKSIFSASHLKNIEIIYVGNLLYFTVQCKVWEWHSATGHYLCSEDGEWF